MTKLILVRHGESTWNVAGRLQGQTMDVPLTERGVEQARLAAQIIEDMAPPGTTVWSSDQLRAVRTAQVLAGSLRGPLRFSTLLREQGLGNLEGRLTSELRAEPVPQGRHISEIRWGGGESVADVHARSLTFLSRLPPGDAVVVGHGDSLRILLAASQGGGHRDVDYDVAFDNCAPVVVARKDLG